MILVDTSVWIDHLHRSQPGLVALLERNEVVVHPMVIAELALGSLAERTGFLALLENLPRSERATDAEVLAFIESEALFSRGLSVVDVHLLAAVRLDAASRLWTRDKRLLSTAEALGVSHG